MKVKTFVLGCLIGMFVALLIYAPISQTQTGRQYDPWADMNDDGFIGIDDIAYGAQLFGTTGDPARPVVVNGYYAKEWNETFQLDKTERKILWIPTKGLREITFKISIWPTVWEYTSSTTKVGYANATIYIRKQILNQTIDWESVDLDAEVIINEGYYFSIVWIYGNTSITKEYDIGFSSMEIEVYARNPIECNAILYVTA
ncbi:hypothetical protein J7K27_06475 [Candidatus Bathyarchaeota archaeon]|nr:hypothetical protein [Candidatus Bathyarchaeota archaeon]